MADREKLLKYFKAGGDEEIAAKLIDLAEKAQKSRKYTVSDFLDPHAFNIAEIIAANYEGIKVLANGGFNRAERNKVAFVSEDFLGTPDFGIIPFLVAWDKRFYKIGHRDILGAFMSMGCKREILGDIVIVPEGAQFVADKAFEAYITSNLTEIGSASISLTSISVEELAEKEEQTKIITATVAALRIDAVAAAGYGVSRSRMADEIKSQNVKINWKEAKNASQSVEAGDVISYRGRGRVEVEEIRGTTKKGRISIVLKRYI